jgi:hypothetical protein
MRSARKFLLSCAACFLLLVGGWYCSTEFRVFLFVRLFGPEGFRLQMETFFQASSHKVSTSGRERSCLNVPRDSWPFRLVGLLPLETSVCDEELNIRLKCPSCLLNSRSIVVVRQGSDIPYWLTFRQNEQISDRLYFVNQNEE